MANEKRLTEKHYNGKGYYLLCSGVLRCDNKCDECEELYKAIDRLGEYEDKAEQTVDSVEVVRCGECKHLTADGLCWEKIRGSVGYKETSPDDFCSYGERR